MPEPIPILLAVLAGLGLGVFFFGGLWLTVRALPRSKHPTVLVLGSFWGRTALVVAGLTLAMARRWENAVACLIGFLLARLLLRWWIPGSPPAGIRGE